MGKKAVLFYLFAEPKRWADGRPISGDHIDRHRNELRCFTQNVGHDEVMFRACSYSAILELWKDHGQAEVRHHCEEILARFDVTTSSEFISCAASGRD
jgi:hypothetical protein